MATIITREVGATAKGTPLTNTELDNNFINLNAELGTKLLGTPNSGISGWTYSGVSRSVATEETAPSGLFFKSDGTKMYLIGSTGDDVTEYVLSTPWNISTATFTAATNNPFSVAGQDTAPADIFFKPDGMAFYIVGDTNNAIFQYTLGTAWDITTASYDSKTFSVNTQEATPTSVWFKPDGTEMFVVGVTTDTVYKYTIPALSAWDVSTASYSGVSFSVASQEANPQAIEFDATGTNMYIVGSTGDDINHWGLSTPWDFSTAVFVGKVYVGFQELGPTAIYINFAESKAWIAGSTSDSVHQYNTNATAFRNTDNNLLIDGYTRINNNAYIEGAVKIDGALTVDGGFTLAGSISASGNIVANQISTSTSAITLGGTITTGATTITSTQTTGVINVGGTAATGAITIGQSTAAQTLNLGTGATANATTKTVNIGTGGLAGSTTNISIGSAVSGVASNITANGVWTYNNIANFINPGNQLLIKNGTASDSTVIHRKDGADYYILLSDASTTPNGTWNALRPFVINQTTGLLSSQNGQAFSGGTTVANTLNSTGILKAAQILQGVNTFVRDYASGYSQTVAASTVYEIGRLTFTGVSQNVAIVGEIRGGSGSSVGVNRFILNIRTDSPLSSKVFTLFEEETTNLGRVINLRVYHDTASGLVVIGYTASESLQNIGWSLRVQERGDYNYLQQTTSLTTLNTAGLTQVTPTSTVRTISSSLVVANGITANVTGNATNVTGVVALANGGSGTTTAQSAINAFAGAVTSGQYLRGDGTNVVMSAIQAADVPSLDANKITSGTIDAARLPSYVDDVIEAASLAGFPATGETGKIYVALDNNKTYRWSGSVYISFNSGAVDSVAGKTGIVTLVASDVGAQPAGNYVTTDTEQTITAAKVVSVSSSGNALRITQTGAGNALLVEDETNADATPFVIDANGNVVIGTLTPSTTAYPLYVESTAGILTAGGSNTAINSPTLATGRRRTGGAAVISGDSIGKLSSFGWDGTNFIEATRIEGTVDGTPGQIAGTFTIGLSYKIQSVGTTDFTLIGAASNTVGITFTATGAGTGTGTAILATGDMPGRLTLSTTADGASSPTERIRITHNGKTGFATTVPAATVHVAGDTIFSNVNVLAATYDNVSFSVAAQEGTPQDIFFSPDGTHMYITGSSGDDINEYVLSTPWLISSAVFVTTFVPGQGETAPVGFFFRADGRKLYVVGQTNDTVYQFTLATPWSITTATYDTVFFSVLTQEAAPTAISFKPDGLSMYILGATTTDAVYQYTLSTAWDVSTAVFLQSFNVTNQETLPAGLAFTGDGTRMFVCGTTGDDINVYNLTTPWDVSTAIFVNVLSVAGQETAPNGIYIKPDGTKMYVIGSTNDSIYQYTVPSINIQLTGPVSAGSLAVQQDLNVYGNSSSYAASFTSYTEGTFVVTGTTPALSPTNATIQTWTLTANSTPTAGTWANGQSLTLMIDDGTARIITWTSVGVTWKTNGGIAPLLNTTGFTVIQLWKVGGVIYGARVGDA